MTPLSLLLAAGLGLSLAGCQNDPNGNGGKGDGTIRRTIWSDPDTGCQYHFWQSGISLANNYAIALAPRLGRDGKPVCSPLPAAQGGR